jgi:hypothetical protein
MSKILFVIVGGARTFLNTMDNIYDHVITPFSQHSEKSDVYYYLKNFDPGPKQQEGWNYSYQPIISNELIDKINTKPNIGYKIIEKDIPDEILYHQIKNRHNFNGFFNKKTIHDKPNYIYHHLARSMQMHLNFKNVYEYILKCETKYDIIFFIRPDLMFIDTFKSYQEYNLDKIHINYDYNDHWEMIPIKYVKEYLHDPYQIYLTNNKQPFNNAESILRKCIENIYNVHDINYSICRSI